MTHQTIEAYDQFARRYPNSALTPELKVAMEPLFFERARATNTVAGYQAVPRQLSRR